MSTCPCRQTATIPPLPLGRLRACRGASRCSARSKAGRTAPGRRSARSPWLLVSRLRQAATPTALRGGSPSRNIEGSPTCASGVVCQVKHQRRPGAPLRLTSQVVLVSRDRGSIHARQKSSCVPTWHAIRWAVLPSPRNPLNCDSFTGWRWPTPTGSTSIPRGSSK